MRNKNRHNSAMQRKPNQIRQNVVSNPHIEGNVIHFHNIESTPTTSKASYNGKGYLNLGEYIRQRLGLTVGQSVWLIDDDGIAIVIRKDFDGYGDCDRYECVVTRGGKVQLPNVFHQRVELDEENNATLSLSYGHEEVAIETFAWASMLV